MSAEPFNSDAPSRRIDRSLIGVMPFGTWRGRVCDTVTSAGKFQYTTIYVNCCQRHSSRTKLASFVYHSSKL
jgi:hypothetical protein